MPLPEPPSLRRARVRALTVALVSAAAVILPSPTGSAAPAAELVLRGRGHGHGVGMTHDGALALGRQGRSAREILATFYPGTNVGHAGATVRVLVHDTALTDRITVTLPGGGVLRPERHRVSGLPLRVPAGATVELVSDGARVTAITGGTRVPAPGGLLVLPDTVTALGGATYRGVLRVLTAEGRLRAVNHLDVEDYLRGMGEVRDSSWPDASLRAQAVAARTYAVHAVRYSPRHRDFDLYADDRSQVYLGAHAEYGAMDDAVAATRGDVLRYDGAVVNAVYSTNGGGVTATTLEGFGPSRLRHPYLTSVRYPTADPAPWTFRRPLRDVAQRLRYPGTIRSVQITPGPSGRALSIRLTGTAGALDLPGIVVAERLDLRSTLFSVVRPAPAAAVSATSPRAARPAPRQPPLLAAAPMRAATGPRLDRRTSGSARTSASGVAWLLIAAVAAGLLREARSLIVVAGELERSEEPAVTL